MVVVTDRMYVLAQPRFEPPSSNRGNGRPNAHDGRVDQGHLRAGDGVHSLVRRKARSLSESQEHSSKGERFQVARWLTPDLKHREGN